jgi:hypothetical protein
LSFVVVQRRVRNAQVSINWTILGQAAQAAKDARLIECVDLCHPETARTCQRAEVS